MSSSIGKHIEMEKKLTVDWQSNHLVRTANSDFDFFNKVVQETDPLKQGWRLPWELIDYTNLYNMKYHITINPDPECGWITSVNNLKEHNIKFREFIRECKNNNLYKNIISIYEYGKNGKEHGKVHYHILLQTNKINKFIEMAITYFGTSNKTRWRHTVVKKAISIDRNISVNATIEEKVNNYNSQINFIMHNYMKKESQNRQKCLYTNMKKKI